LGLSTLKVEIFRSSGVGSANEDLSKWFRNEILQSIMFWNEFDFYNEIGRREGFGVLMGDGSEHGKRRRFKDVGPRILVFQDCICSVLKF